MMINHYSCDIDINIVIVNLNKKYTQFHLAVKMKDYTMLTLVHEKELFTYIIYNRNRHIFKGTYIS